MPKLIDIACIIALKEEFKTFFDAFHLVKTNDIENEYGHWYERVFNDEGINYKFYCSFVGDMGPAHMIKYTTKFLTKYSPKLLINFGLSGSLSDDIGLGDIIFADNADLYDDVGAIEDVNGNLSIKFSGDSIPCSYLKSLIDNLEYSKRKKYREWLNVCKNEFENLRIKDHCHGIVLNNEINLVTGHIACGSLCVKSSLFKSMLKNKDRKYLAVDMESAGLALSAENSGSKILIARVISDTANENKALLDRLGEEDKGIIRKWALSNGISFIGLFLTDFYSHGSIHEDFKVIEGGDIATDFDELVPEVLSAYKRIGPEVLNMYGSFFSYFQDNYELNIPFDSILKQIEKLDQSQNNYFSISGLPGTGKSAILSCLYLKQVERYWKNETNFAPIYMNLKNLWKDYFYDNKNIYKEIENDLFGKIHFFHAKNIKNIILIIDGYDDYHRNPIQTEIERAFNDFIEFSSDNETVIKIVGIGHIEQDTFIKENHSISAKMGNVNSILSLYRLRDDSPIFKNVVESYVALISGSTKLVEKILITLSDYEIKEIDLYLLSLICNSIKMNLDANKKEGIASLYKKFCHKKLTTLSKDRGTFQRNVEILIRELAKSVYNKYISSESSKNDLEIDEKLKLYHYLDIAYEHPTIKEYLIAYHIIEKILEEDLGNGLFDRIYPYGINRFVKSILNENEDVQSKIFTSIKNLYPKANFFQKANLVYMLGRYENRSFRTSARHLLNEFYKEAYDYSLGIDDYENPTNREILALLRTISVSLVYLENPNASEKYISKLLEDENWDKLNRGFHLSYYHDLKEEASSPLNVSFDELEVSPIQTFSRLHQKITRSISQRSLHPMFQIELYTLCSLCVNRHLVGTLDSSLKPQIIHLLDSVLKSDWILFNEELKSYLIMSYGFLKRENISTGDIVSELFNLKETKRAGWNAERPFKGKMIKRTCPNPESVADHTFGCLIIAELFLPEKSKHIGYSKSEIIRMLLLHDLAEAYHGDKENYNKTVTDEEIENETMVQISSLRGLDVFSGFKHCKNRWNQYQSSRFNGEIAQDIDKIENYIQLHIYDKRTDCIIPDREDWASGLRNNLKTNIGREIIRKLSLQLLKPQNS